MSRRRRRSKRSQDKTRALAKQRNQVSNSSNGGQPSVELSAGMVISSSYAGPIPPPAMMREFNELVPGIAEKIFQLAEDQARHRMSLEQGVIRSNIKKSLYGMWLGFALGVGVIFVAYTSITAGHATQGAAMTIFALVSMVTVFAVGIRSARQERIEKSRQLTQQTGRR